VEIALTVKLIGEAMTGNKFWLDSTSQEAWIVSRATALGYVLRLSHTQVQWTEAGLEKARRELPEMSPGDQLLTSLARAVSPDLEEEARQAAKDRYSVVKGLWIEPAAKVQTTSDGKRHVMAWIMVDE
jgi:hypothetical protein